jgi:hypothetical protein
MKMTEELKTFVKSNKQLLNANTKESWEALLLKAKNESNKLVNDFIAMIDGAKIKSFGLDVYKYAKDKKEFQDCNGQSIELSEIKLFLLKHKVCLSVTIEDEKIIIVGIEERTPDLIWENPRLANLFERYSNITLEKAKGGDFKDLIHFVEYHTLRKIRQKNKEDIENIYKEIEETREEEEEKESSVNKGQRELDYLGCFVPALCEIWLCGSLIKETANKLADEYMQKLFPNSSLLKNDIEAAQLSMAKLLLEKVLTHEFGHLVFKWTNQQDGYIQEKQANYFSSYINDGKIDGFIVDFTRRQPVEYHNPYLIGDKHADELYKSNN